tara:strand:- start:781 stop:1401 length:621 start_codon:yes stop_codon:yes gene_type:complete
MKIKIKILYFIFNWVIFFSLFNIYGFSMTNPKGGGGLSYSGRLGINMFGEFEGSSNKEKHVSGYFISLGTPFTGERNSKNTYTHSELTFDDINIETQTEYSHIVGGLFTRINDKQSIYLGGGLTLGQTFLKRYDNVNNLPYKDIYYVQDDDKDSYSITGTVGIMRDIEQGIFNLKKYGCIINIYQLTINANIIVLWSGNLFDYLPK